MRHLTATNLLVLSALMCTSTLAAAPSAMMPKPMTLNGIINADADDTLAFTPDGNTVFFDRSEGKHKTVLISHRSRGVWSPPTVASFSGRWFDQNPIVAPDGSYLLFNSDRPIRYDGPSLTQTYFSKTAAPGSNLWRVDRKGNGWSEPRWLGPSINNDVFVDFAAIAQDNTLYFMRWDAPNKNMQLWRATFRAGTYEEPECVKLGDPMASIHDPAIARDQSFIVFDYGKVAGGLGRLSIAFRHANAWSRPLDMGDAVNAGLPWGAHLSPDGRSIFVTDRTGIQRISLAPWLNGLGNQ